MKPWLIQEQQKLIKLIQKDALPHALIVSGVMGAGKGDLSHWLAKALICQGELNSQQGMFPCQRCKACNLFDQQTHPDYKNIELVGSTIGVDQIRTVSRFFEKTAQLGLNQIVIIQDAEKMTESAANALLKTLEEPTANSYILLLVNDEQRLMPTIISRCRHIQIRPPVGDDLFKQISQTSIVNEAFANLSHLPEMTDNEINSQYQSFVHDVLLYFYSSQQRMALVSKLLEIEHTSRWLEKVVVNLMRAHYQWLEQNVPSEINITEFSHFLLSKREQLWQVYQLICSYNKQQLTITQFNKEFGIEKLMVDIQSVMAQ